MGMWLNPQVKAVIASTGGYGAVRLLPHLDPAVFSNNPKALVGYSDITALHLWLMRRANLRSFHGPTVDDLIPSSRDPTMASLITALTVPCPTARIGRELSRGVVPGSAKGRLVGGNLSLVQQTIGTSYQVDMDGAILFIEETRDPMSVVDERLVHLRAAGLLENAVGDRLRPALARPLGGGRVRGFSSRPDLRSRRARADGLSRGARESEPHDPVRHGGRARRRRSARLDHVSGGRALRVARLSTTPSLIPMKNAANVHARAERR